MNSFQLYCFAESGNAYKAALMLTLSRASWEAKFVDFFNGGSRTPEFLALNSMGEVPVLVHNDTCLSQSGVILTYLSRTLGTFAPENDAEEQEILRWLLFDNHKLTSYLATLRFLRNFTKNADPSIVSFFEARGKSALKTLNRHLQAQHEKSQQFVIADRPTFVDFSLCGYLYFPDEIGFSFESYEHVLNWLSAIQDLDGWKHPYDLMPSKPPS